MDTVIPILGTSIFVCLMTAMGAALVHNVLWYRISAVTLLLAVTVINAITHGWPGILVVLTLAFIVLPFLAYAVINTVIRLTWWKVRKSFPDDPKQPPGGRATLFEIYRTFWTIE